MALDFVVLSVREKGADEAAARRQGRKDEEEVAEEHGQTGTAPGDIRDPSEGNNVGDGRPTSNEEIRLGSRRPLVVGEELAGVLGATLVQWARLPLCTKSGWMWRRRALPLAVSRGQRRWPASAWCRGGWRLWGWGDGWGRPREVGCLVQRSLITFQVTGPRYSYTPFSIAPAHNSRVFTGITYLGSRY